MRANKQMKEINEELARIEDQIRRLQIERDVLVRVRAKALGEEPEPKQTVRTRAPAIKPLILDLMAQAGTAGATGSMIAEQVRDRVPAVAKDTPGSLLSRLKADGALVHDGERYYDKRFAPNTTPEVVRAVP